jgi:hypothetical protein
MTAYKFQGQVHQANLGEALVFEVMAAPSDDKEITLECAKVLERVLRNVSYGKEDGKPQNRFM